MRPFRSNLLGRRALRALAAACTFLIPAFAVHARADIPFVNHSQLDDDALVAELHRAIPPDRADDLRERGLALLVHTMHVDSMRACVALAGVTTPPPPGRSARVPGARFTQVEVMSPGEWDAAECRARAVRGALSALGKAARQDLLHDVASTRPATGRRTAEKPDPTRVHLEAYGLPDAGSVFEVLHRTGISKGLDYRHAMYVVVATGGRLDSGGYACAAVAGLAARATADRNGHWPVSSVGMMRSDPSGTAAQCRQRVAASAVEELLTQPWGPDGLLRSIEATREDDVPLPDPKRLAAAARDREAAPRPEGRTTR
jgi:hypothetical protein